jgi:hypothetical protein
MTPLRWRHLGQTTQTGDVTTVLGLTTRPEMIEFSLNRGDSLELHVERLLDGQ